MNIYIPTYGRADKQLTFAALPDNWREQTWFVIRPEEKEKFSWWPKVIVCEAKGVPAARQAALEHSTDDHVFFFDDDLRFACRIEDWSLDDARLRKMTKEDLSAALDLMEAKLSEYAAVGFDARGGNNNRPERFEKETTRLMRAFGVQKSALLRENIRFDKYLFWEDFHVVLSLIELGYLNFCSMVYCNDGTTNSSGGVSSYRKVEQMREVQAALCAEHPCMKPVIKNVKSWQGNLEDVPDVIVYWRKALATRANERK